MYRILLTLLIALAFVGCTESAPDQSLSADSLSTSDSDPHSYARPEEARITHLSWDVSVDFEQKMIAGTATYTIWRAADANRLVLDSKGLLIDKAVATETGEQLTVTLGQEDPILGQPVIVDLPGGITTVSVMYRTTPGAEALQWLSPQQTADKEAPFLFTQSQAILARTWIPLQDSPGIRFTYDATVQVPPGLMAIMSAENPESPVEDGIYHFRMQQPIPSYLMALAVGRLDRKSVGNRTAVYAEPSQLEAAAYEFADMEAMVETAEALYGPYTWDRYDVVVLPPSFPFGGMENPRLTFLTPTVIAGDRSLTALIAHELAHSWSGNLVTNANWNDFWLNEGFTVYFESRIMEALYGYSYSAMLQQLGYQDLMEDIASLHEDGLAADTRLKLDLAGRNPDDGLTDVAYEKGALFLRHIESKVGREPFDAFLRHYFDEYAFQPMTTELFLSILDTAIVKGDTALAAAINANEWVYGEDLPEDHPIVQTDRFEKVEAQIQLWLSGTPAERLTTASWTTHEWLHFLRNLPVSLTASQMKELDDTFQLSASGNAEITAVWLVHVVNNQYENGYDKLEDFLVHVGRRKFLMPIYKALVATEEGKIRASAIFEKAQNNYHAVAAQSVAALLQ